MPFRHEHSNPFSSRQPYQRLKCWKRLGRGSWSRLDAPSSPVRVLPLRQPEPARRFRQMPGPHVRVDPGAASPRRGPRSCGIPPLQAVQKKAPAHAPMPRGATPLPEGLPDSAEKSRALRNVKVATREQRRTWNRIMDDEHEAGAPMSSGRLARFLLPRGTGKTLRAKGTPLACGSPHGGVRRRPAREVLAAPPLSRSHRAGPPRRDCASQHMGNFWRPTMPGASGMATRRPRVPPCRVKSALPWLRMAGGLHGQHDHLSLSRDVGVLLER